MIRSVTLENFFSFRDETLLDFRTSARTPTDHSFTASRMGDQVSLLTGVFGANASGKTNLLKSIAFLNYFMRSSYEMLQPDAEVPVDAFLLQQQEPVRFHLEYEGLGDVYRYFLSIRDSSVLEERLQKRHPKTLSFRTLISRQAGERFPKVEADADFVDPSAVRKLLRDRPNASVLSAGNVTGQKGFLRALEALGHIETNVNRSGKASFSDGTNLKDLTDAAEYFQDNPQFMADVEARLQSADLGISKMEIRKLDIMNPKGETEERAVPFLRHRSGKDEFMMPITHESSGTRRLFLLLRSFLPVLTEGGMVVIDEMESDLHPHLIPLFLDLFTDEDTNPKRAQLLFTCHHVEILNHLAKEQIVLVDKDSDNISHAQRLSDIKGVRREENFFANYNAGRYQAVPEPELF
jgi:hypothetical protein